MEARYLDDFIHHVLCCEQLGIVERTIARFQREIVMFFAHKALLMKILAHQKLANEEEIEDVEYIAQRRSQFFRFVIVKTFDRFRFFSCAMFAQRVFDQFPPVAVVGVR